MPGRILPLGLNARERKSFSAPMPSDASISPITRLTMAALFGLASANALATICRDDTTSRCISVLISSINSGVMPCSLRISLPSAVTPSISPTCLLTRLCNALNAFRIPRESSALLTAFLNAGKKSELTSFC